MDEKTITAVSTSLALMQIQANALLLLVERHTPGVPIKEEFQQLISEGVQTVGLEPWRASRAGSVRESFSKRRRIGGMAIIDQMERTSGSCRRSSGPSTRSFPMHSEWSLNNLFQPCAWFSGHISDTRAQLG
jgi:hypothetical protein